MLGAALTLKTTVAVAMEEAPIPMVMEYLTRTMLVPNEASNAQNDADSDGCIDDDGSGNGEWKRWHQCR
jgi:hypothetical protein